MTELDWIVMCILTSVAIGWLVVVAYLIGRQNGHVDQLMKRVEREHLA